MPRGAECRILIEKGLRRLTAVIDGRERCYPIRLGRNSSADKTIEGDHATPLGDFYVCAKNPRSKYFLSLCLSYPNAEDAERGLAARLIGDDDYARILDAIRSGTIPPQHTRLGGEIYIHGAPAHPVGEPPLRDWTQGCIAVDNAAMQVLYDAAVIGTAVRIVD